MRSQSWHVAQDGAHTRAVGKSQQWSWAVSIFLLLLVLGLYKCIYTLYEWCLGFLKSCSQSHWFSNKLRRFVLSVFNPRTGVPNMRLNLLTPQRGPSNLYNHCPLLCLLQEVQAPNWLLAFPSFQTQCKSYLETATENSLSVSFFFFFSVKIPSHVDVFLMFSLKGGEFYVLLSHHLDLSRL